MNYDTAMRSKIALIFLVFIQNSLSFSHCFGHTFRVSKPIDVHIGGCILQVSPQFTKNGHITLYTLNDQGVFRRCTSSPEPLSGEIVYSVLKNGILMPQDGPYSMTYDIDKKGDLIPRPSNECVYKSDRATFYLKGTKKMLIPVDIFISGDFIYYIFGHNQLIYSEPIKKSINRLKMPGFLPQKMSIRISPESPLIVPDKSCSGDVVLFLLRSNGVFARNPPDEYLPNGMRLKYELKDDGSLSPLMSKKPEALKLTYVTSENGNLKPCEQNTHTLTTMNETTKSFILGEGGVLAPVSEVMLMNKSINYFYDGQLIHSSNQFKKMYSNASVVYLTEKSRNLSQNPVDSLTGGPRFQCSPKRLVKRDTRTAKYDSSRESIEDYAKNHPVKPQCAFAYDDQGKRIPLEPFRTENGKIALYKLTCKGHLKRMDAHTEPECDFEVHFKVLDNFIMVPISKNNGKFCMKYTLKETGNLVPVKNQKNSFKKAPASVVYYLLLRNKQLLPVRLNILKCNHIEVYYQDCLIHTIAPEIAKSVEVFTTLYSPLYAYCNGRIVILYSDPIPKSISGSTWHNPSKIGDSITYPCKNLYLVGPNKTKIKIELALNHNRVPQVYELDWNGVFHKSPKDDNKNMILKSYKFLSKGVLLPTNDSNGYIFLVDKHGDMLPYCYPESKLRAPNFLTVKYVLCKEGVLMPVLVEALSDHIRLSYEKNVIYSKKAYTLDEIIEITDDNAITSKNEDIKYYKEKCGSFVYFEKIGECLHRHPSQKVEDYLIDHMGYLKIMPCGTLMPMTYPDPTCDYIKVQLLANGDLSIVSQNGKKIKWNDYLLTDAGCLIPVDVKKKGDQYKFYKNGNLIRNRKDDLWRVDEASQNSDDPLGIFKDPEPKGLSNDEPHKIEISMDEVTPTPEKGDKCNKVKCDKMKKIIKEMISKDKSLIGMDMLMSDQVQKEISDMVSCCSKLKEKRSIQRISSEDSSLGDDSC